MLLELYPTLLQMDNVYASLDIMILVWLYVLNVLHRVELVQEQLHFVNHANHQIRDLLYPMLALVLMVLQMLVPRSVFHAIILVRHVWHLVIHAQLVRSMQ